MMMIMKAAARRIIGKVVLRLLRITQWRPCFYMFSSCGTHKNRKSHRVCCRRHTWRTCIFMLSWKSLKRSRLFEEEEKKQRLNWCIRRNDTLRRVFQNVYMYGHPISKEKSSEMRYTYGEIGHRRKADRRIYVDHYENNCAEKHWYGGTQLNKNKLLLYVVFYVVLIRSDNVEGKS